MIIAQNESDATFGWNGVMQGFNVHYQHPETEMFIPGHSVYLSSRLTPIISVQNVQQTFLGDPVSFLFYFTKRIVGNDGEFRDRRCVDENYLSNRAVCDGVYNLYSISREFFYPVIKLMWRKRPENSHIFFLDLTHEG